MRTPRPRPALQPTARECHNSRNAEGVLSKVERMRQELDDLEAELRQASEAGARA